MCSPPFGGVAAGAVGWSITARMPMASMKSITINLHLHIHLIRGLLPVPPSTGTGRPGGVSAHGTATILVGHGTSSAPDCLVACVGASVLAIGADGILLILRGLINRRNLGQDKVGPASGL